MTKQIIKLKLRISVMRASLIALKNVTLRSTLIRDVIFYLCLQYDQMIGDKNILI